MPTPALSNLIFNFLSRHDGQVDSSDTCDPKVNESPTANILLFEVKLKVLALSLKPRSFVVNVEFFFHLGISTFSINILGLVTNFSFLSNFVIFLGLDLYHVLPK